jgi:hypothetical protein
VALKDYYVDPERLYKALKTPVKIDDCDEIEIRFPEMTLVEDRTRPIVKCECGADKLKMPFHSDYCPRYVKL